MENMTYFTKRTAALLFLVLLITACIYLPGLKGSFLFDDFPNLGDMNRYGDIHSWNNAKQFIFNGFSGPTGRPISLATFWLTASSWIEGNAFPFKLINLFIHLTCGLLLFFIIKLLLKEYEYDDKKSDWIALLTISLWLVHPMFVSTTLYVVQRMTQLSLVFSLFGIWGYLYGRSLLTTKTFQAYTWMTLSIGFATILATFSKENGALLPLLILVIEYCHPNNNNKPLWQWSLLCLWLPSLLISYIILKEINLSTTPWPSRNFNQIERLMSEARIVTEYLFRLYFPQIEGQGLYQDGYTVSRSLFNPITTIYSIIFLVFLFISAVFFKKKYPLYALAILFFFAAHFMESTFLGLELYFEHRNYAAAIFIFLPLAASLYWLSQKIKPKLVVIISCIIIVIFSSMTLQRSILWANTQNLKLYWAQNNPDSPRAQVDFARYLLAQGKVTEANDLLLYTIERRPDSSLLTVRLIRQKLDSEQLKLKDFDWMKSVIIHQRPEPQAALDLRYLIEQIRVDKQRLILYGQPMIEVLRAMSYDSSTRWSNKNWQGLFLYLEGKLHLANHNYQEGYDAFIKSLAISNNAETAIAMTMEFTQVDNHILGYKFLNEVQETYILEDLKKDKRLNHIFHELKSKLEQDLGYKE